MRRVPLDRLVAMSPRLDPAVRGTGAVVHVLIVGAGIGGLALAQGLLEAGVETTVLERDTDLGDTGGYSLHLRPDATAGLRALLPETLWSRLRDAAGAGPQEQGRVIRDHRGRLVVVDRSAASTGSLDVDRITLRLLLAEGLGDRLRLGVSGLGYVAHDDGTVTVRTDGGGDVRCDVLVAADGVGSAVTTQLAGGPTSRPVGLLGVAGRTPPEALSATTRRLLRPRSTLSVGPGGSGVYVGRHPTGLVWGAILLDWAGTRSLPDLEGGPLLAETAQQLRRRSWVGPLLDVVEHADPSTASAFRLHAGARYPAGLAPWAAGPVTALGDAVHAMPPTGGQGAGTALRDAHELGSRLLTAAAGQQSVLSAVEAYQQAMRPYAAAAVAASLQPVSWTRTATKPLGTAVAAAGLPAAAAVSWAVRAGRRGDPATV